MNFSLQFEWLDSKITSTFKDVANRRYNTKFELGNSNVVSLLPNLELLKENISKGIYNSNVTEQVIIEETDISNIIHSLSDLLERYKQTRNIPLIPKTLKWYQLRDEYRKASSNTVKEVLEEVLKPKVKKKLSREEKTAERAAEISKQKKLDIMKSTQIEPKQ